MGITKKFVKGLTYSFAILVAIVVASAIIGAFVFGMSGDADTTRSTTVKPAPTASLTPMPTQTAIFTPHSKYAEAYVPSITEIGNGKDWYMTTKETQMEGAVCTATYTKDEHRTVRISVSIYPTVDSAKTGYTKLLAGVPYVECPTMGVCDQSLQYIEEIPTHHDIEMYREVGTGVIRDENIVVIFKVFEDNMFIGLSSYDMDRYAKNIEKKINAVT